MASRALRRPPLAAQRSHPIRAESIERAPLDAE